MRLDMHAAMQPFKISIILPVHNEASHLLPSVETIRRLASVPASELEIILIDDGSTDESWDAIGQLVKRGVAEIGLKLSRNFGKEAAVRAGLERCQGDCAIIMDSDMQHPPDIIPDMVAKWRDQSFQVVEALKVERSRDSRMQRILSAQFYGTYRALTKINLRGASDFKLLDRTVIDALVKLPEIHQFLRGMTSWMGFETTSIPFEVQDRAGGTTSWSNRQLFAYAIKSLLYFSQKPLYVVSLFSSACLILLSVFLAGRSLLIWWLGSPPSGTTTIVLSLAVFSALISTNQAIGNIYIGRIFEQVKARPIYLVSHELNYVRQTKVTGAGEDH